MKRKRTSSPDKERSFTLPRGHREDGGVEYRSGSMRPSTAADEIAVLKDFRVFLRPDAFVPILLSRVLRFSGNRQATVALMENLGRTDRFHLERLYREVNGYSLEEVEKS